MSKDKKTTNDTDDVFGSTADDVFSAGDDDVVYLDADNADDLLGRFAKPYMFDREPGRPPEGFHVRMATMSALEKWQRYSSKRKPDDPELFRSLCELIADAVVSRSGERVWTTEQITKLATSNAPRFMRLQEAVLDRNDLKKMQPLLEEAAKN